MLKLPVVVALTASVALAAPVAGQDTAAATPKREAPLFASQDVRQFRLEADFGAVFKERGDSSHPHAAKLSYTEDGTPVSLDVQIQTRGRYRLKPQTCNFPPIRVTFPKDAVKKTLFAHQSHLKLTVHCQDKRANYEQSVLLEYLIYRSLNLLTDNSFKARLGRFTYVDAAGKRDTLTRYAFFVEHNSRMAERLGGKVFTGQQHVHDESTEPDQMLLVWVFEYFIGNTDWSVWGLHNIVLVERPNAGVPLAVPYDFDWSGVIDAPYAKPDYRLPIKSVRERLFRGYCRSPEELAQVIQLFNQKKEAIYQLYQTQEGLDPKVRAEALKYYDEFYKTINDPKAVRREFVDNCRKAAD